MSESDAILSLSWGGLLYLAVVLALASFARGYAGFGAPALLITGGSLVASPHVLVPVILLLDTIGGCGQLRGVLANVQWRRVGLLLLGSAAGTPLGVAALHLIDPDTARIVLAVYVMAVCLAMLRGWRLARPVGDVGLGLLGFACGFVTGVIAMGGLVVVAFLTADGTRPAALRATLIAYFLPLGGYAVALFATQGRFGNDGAMVTLLALPILATGVWLGGRHFLSASPEQFRRFTLGLLMVLAVAAFVRAVAG